jgi:hypothetical protein
MVRAGGLRRAACVFYSMHLITVYEDDFFYKEGVRAQGGRIKLKELFRYKCYTLVSAISAFLSSTLLMVAPACPPPPHP